MECTRIFLQSKLGYFAVHVAGQHTPQSLENTKESLFVRNYRGWCIQNAISKSIRASQATITSVGIRRRNGREQLRVKQARK